MNKELLTFSTNRLTIRPLERKDYKVWQAAVKGTLPPKNTFDTYNKEDLVPTYRSFTQILARSKENISRGVTVDFFAFRRGHCASTVSKQKFFLKTNSQSSCR